VFQIGNSAHSETIRRFRLGQKNKYDGTVEAVFEGEDNAVASVLEWCKKGPALAIVGGVDITWQDYSGEFDSFDILR